MTEGPRINTNTWQMNTQGILQQRETTAAWHSIYTTLEANGGSLSLHLIITGISYIVDYQALVHNQGVTVVAHQAIVT